VNTSKLGLNELCYNEQNMYIVMSYEYHTNPYHTNQPNYNEPRLERTNMVGTELFLKPLLTVAS